MKNFLVYILKGKKLDCNKKTLDLSSVVWYNMCMRRLTGGTFVGKDRA